MAMHRQHPDAQFDMPVATATTTLPAASLSHPRSVDVTVCEWTADLGGSLLHIGPARTTVGALGFIDFDALDSVHETTTSDGTVRR